MDVSFLEEAFPNQLKLYIATHPEKVVQAQKELAQERIRAAQRQIEIAQQRIEAAQRQIEIAQQRIEAAQQQIEDEQQRIRVIRLKEEYSRGLQRSKDITINLISQKYKTSPSTSLVNTIRSISSIDTLLDIQDLVYQFDSIEEFEKELDKSAP